MLVPRVKLASVTSEVRLEVLKTSFQKEFERYSAEIVLLFGEQLLKSK